MHSRTLLRTLVTAAALAVVAAACGDDATPPTAVTTGSAGCSPPRPVEAGTTEATFDHDGVTRTYRVTVPDGHDGTTAAPVVVNLHGFTSTAEEQDALSGMADAGAAQGYVVVSPQGLDTDIPISGGVVAPFWNITPAVDTSQIEGPGLGAADDIGFVNALLDRLETDLCLDVEREYLTGMSNGAAMSMALICTDDQRFAAAAPVAGAVFVSECAAQDLTPTLAVHGDADVLAPYEGGDVFGFPLGLPAAEDQLGELAAIGGCQAEPEIETLGDDVEHRTWAGCAGDAEVELYTVLGGGHTWPGSPLFADGLAAEPSDDGADSDRAAEAEGALGFDLDQILGEPTETIDATELILAFFERHAD